MCMELVSGDAVRVSTPVTSTTTFFDGLMMILYVSASVFATAVLVSLIVGLYRLTTHTRRSSRTLFHYTRLPYRSEISRQKAQQMPR